VLSLVLLSSSTATRADVSSTLDLPLFGQLAGKVVLLDFWASWCEPCRHSFPWMSELQRRYQDAGLVVLAVNLDQDRRLAEQFLAAHPAGFRVEYDPAGAIATQFGVGAMPMSFVIDRSGRVREKHLGFRRAQTSEREASLLKLLEE
jgi:thiol-disulfide isomerase/thioredoxin